MTALNAAAELLPWANLLLLPILQALWAINARLSALAATQEAHAGRLASLEGQRHGAD